MPLKLSNTLTLPDDAVTQTFAILGIRGSGKTTTATILTEELLSIGQQVIVIDPVDVTWGLRSSASGKDSGFPVTILGGDHSDLPLEAGSGAVVADFVVDHGASLILSLRHLSMNEQRRFAADFAEHLYARKGKQEMRQPIHLVVDESDEFVPQRLPPGGERMFGAFDRLIRRGRSSGIGLTLISQRPQVVSKDVLSQVETLICHRLIHQLDRKALEAWIEAHDVENQRKEFLDSLASLGRGDAWVWSPEWLGIFQRVHIRNRHTFDSSATPKAGETRQTPKRVAEVNLAALRERMAETIEKAKADDPKELRRQLSERDKRIRELEKQPAAPVAPVVDVEAEVKKAVAAATRELSEFYNRHLEKLPDVVSTAITQHLSAIGEFRAPEYRSPQTPTPARPISRAIVPGPSIPERRSAVNGHAEPLSSAERTILTVLAQYPAGRSRKQLALLSGYAYNSGGLNGPIGQLGKKGYALTGGGVVQITSAGIDALGSWDPLPTGKALREMWLGQLDTAERKILAAILDVYPKDISRLEISEVTGYAYNSGGLNGPIGKLGRLELIESVVPSRVRASSELFD